MQAPSLPRVALCLSASYTYTPLAGLNNFIRIIGYFIACFKKISTLSDQIKEKDNYARSVFRTIKKAVDLRISSLMQYLRLSVGKELARKEEKMTSTATNVTLVTMLEKLFFKVLS